MNSLNLIAQIIITKASEVSGSTDPDTTILDPKVYSGFSDSNYITIPNIYTSDMTSFYQQVCFSVSNFGISNQALIDTQNQETSIRLTISQEGYLRFRRSSTGEQSYDIDIIGNTLLDLNQETYAVLEYNNSTGYTLKHSTDGENWIIDGTSAVTTVPYIAGSNAKFYLGDNVASGYSLSGSINISETVFKVNGTTVFNGATAVAGTDYTIVGTLYTQDILNISKVGLITGLLDVVQSPDNLFETVSPVSNTVGLQTDLANVDAVYVYEPSTGHSDATGLTTGIIGAIAPSDNLYETSIDNSDSVGLSTGIVDVLVEQLTL
jgi:hypothetical protein